MKRNHFGHIDGADPNVLFSLRKTTPAFIGANKKRQARLTGNYSGSQSSFSEMVSKRARKICATETISGFVRSGPLWSIIGLHPDNVGHDAPVWSQILPSHNLIQGSDNNEHDTLEGHGKEYITGMVSAHPFTNLVQGSDSNEHDTLEGHEKEDITSTVSDPPFTNLV